MSPSERDLRASLQRGEGEPIDVDRIVAVGAMARSQRRTRLAGVAAAVVLVVAAGSVTGVVLNRDDGGTTSADSGGHNAEGAAQARTTQDPGIAPGEPAPGSGSDGATTPSLSAPAALCPPSFPERTLPGGTQGGALFARPVATFTLCSYGTPLTSAGGARPAGLAVTGSAAAVLQRSLENAPSSPRGAACTAVRANDQRRIALVPVDAAGDELRIVTTTLSIPICDTRTTNGITTRYGWVPPVGVRQQLYALTPSGSSSSLPARVPSGKNIGTPVR